MSYETMQTGCLTGGVKKSSGVQVQPDVAASWSEVRNDKITEVDWVLVAADKSDGPKSKKVTTLLKGSGGIERCAASLPKDGTIVYGGVRLANNRFVSFIFIDEDLTPAMAKGRAIMYKNGVLNVFEGCDCEIEMRRDLTEHEVLLHIEKVTGFAIPGAVKPRPAVPVINSNTSKLPETAKSNRAPVSANVKPITMTAQAKPMPKGNGLQMSSGVEVQPDVVESWSEVRSDKNKEVDWVLTAADKNDGPKTKKITTLLKGSGGIEKCAASLPKDGTVVYGGARLVSGRFVSFMFIDEDLTPAMARARAIMYKNEMLNVFEGCDCEIEMKRDLTEREVLLHIEKVTGFAVVLPDAGSPRSSAVSTTAAVNDSYIKSTFKQPEGANPNGIPSVASLKKTTMSASVYGQQGCVSYARLKAGADLPPGVDPKLKEFALSDREFVEVFGMAKRVFQDLPAWKRSQKKKDVGLF